MEDITYGFNDGGVKNYTYFEIVDLIDRVFLPKSQIDYTKVKSESLVEKYKQEASRIGFTYIDNYVIFMIESFCKDVYVDPTYREKEHNDKLNNRSQFYIQNQLSFLKSCLIEHFKPNILRIHPGKIINVREMGATSELRQRFTRENVESYIREVLTSTPGESWLRDFRANDIFSHFGLLTGKDFRINNRIIHYNKDITNAIERNDVKFITDVVFCAISDCIDKTDQYYVIRDKLSTSERQVLDSLVDPERNLVVPDVIHGKTEEPVGMNVEMDEIRREMADLREQLNMLRREQQGDNFKMGS